MHHANWGTTWTAKLITATAKMSRTTSPFQVERTQSNHRNQRKSLKWKKSMSMFFICFGFILFYPAIIMLILPTRPPTVSRCRSLWPWQRLAAVWLYEVIVFNSVGESFIRNRGIKRTPACLLRITYNVGKALFSECPNRSWRSGESVCSEC